MANRKPLINSDGEVRELTARDMEKFKPAAEVLPRSLRRKLGVRGRRLKQFLGHRTASGSGRVGSWIISTAAGVLKREQAGG